MEDNIVLSNTFDNLQMYKEYCIAELAEGRDIPLFSEFISIMNE